MSNYTKQDRSKRKYNPKRSKAKDQTQVTREDDVSTGDSTNTKLSNGPINDVEWYKTYPELIQSTCMLAGGSPIGRNYAMTSGWDLKERILRLDATCMQLRFAHGPGKAEGHTDPINMAGTKMYSFVRHANSGHANYEPTDLNLYFLAVMECYNWIAYAERAYGLIYMYNSQNRSMPITQVEAAGFNYEDLSTNMANFRYYINAAIARLNSLYIPTEMKAAKRWWWMLSNVFMDSNIAKAYTYTFVPQFYRTYEEDTGKPGFLKAHGIKQSMTTVQWRTIMNTMLEKLLQSEDIGIISGDILKAYGKENTFVLSAMPEVVQVPFVYSPEVLSQINNTRIITGTADSWDITQVSTVGKGNYLVYDPKFTYSTAEEVHKLSEDWILNFHSDQPTQDEVVVATRNVPLLSDYNAEEKWSHLTMGSEVVTGEKIFYGTSSIDVTPSYKESTDAASLRGLAKHLQFDYAPMVVVAGDVTVDNTTTNNLIPAGPNIDNVIIVSIKDMHRIHDAALLSLFSAVV